MGFRLARVAYALILLSPVAARALSVPAGAEFQVNTYTTDFQTVSGGRHGWRRQLRRRLAEQPPGR